MENNKSDKVAYLLKLRSQIEDRIRELSADALAEFEYQKLVEDEKSCEESNSNKHQRNTLVYKGVDYLLTKGELNSCKGCCFGHPSDGFYKCLFPNSCDRECGSELIYKRVCVTCGKVFEDYAISCQDCQHERKMAGY